MLALICCVQNSYAAINTKNASTVSQEVADIFKNILGTILSANMGVLGSVIAPLINVFAILIFLILYSLFVSTGLTGDTVITMLSFPFQIK